MSEYFCFKISNAISSCVYTVDSTGGSGGGNWQLASCIWPWPLLYCTLLSQVLWLPFWEINTATIGNALCSVVKTLKSVSLVERTNQPKDKVAYWAAKKMKAILFKMQILAIIKILIKNINYKILFMRNFGPDFFQIRRIWLWWTWTLSFKLG